MSNYRYVSNRVLKNRAEKENGWIKVRVPNGSDTAEGMYKCPECENQGKVNQEFKKPLNIKCGRCGFLMRMSRLKDEMKREKKLR